MTSIEEIESRLISKPREEFLNHNFSVHGALCANQSSSIVSRLMSECKRSRLLNAITLGRTTFPTTRLELAAVIDNYKTTKEYAKETTKEATKEGSKPIEAKVKATRKKEGW